MVDTVKEASQQTAQSQQPSLAPNQPRFCSQCGAPLTGLATFCSQCGAMVKQPCATTSTTAPAKAPAPTPTDVAPALYRRDSKLEGDDVTSDNGVGYASGKAIGRAINRFLCAQMHSLRSGQAPAAPTKQGGSAFFLILGVAIFLFCIFLFTIDVKQNDTIPAGVTGESSKVGTQQLIDAYARKMSADRLTVLLQEYYAGTYASVDGKRFVIHAKALNEQIHQNDPAAAMYDTMYVTCGVLHGGLIDSTHGIVDDLRKVGFTTFICTNDSDKTYEWDIQSTSGATTARTDIKNAISGELDATQTRVTGEQQTDALDRGTAGQRNSVGEQEQARPLDSLAASIGHDAEKSKKANADGLQLLKATNPDFQAAKRTFEEAVRSDSSNAEALNNLGYVYQRLGDFRTSEVYTLKAIQLAPDRRVAYGNLGYVQAKLGKSSEASHSFCEYVNRFNDVEQGKATLKRVMSDPDVNVQSAVNDTIAQCSAR
jgi:Flp pilus assembly protein TadD